MATSSCWRREAATQPARAEYVDAKTCAGCHSAIWSTYQKTGMARSFYRATPASMGAEAGSRGRRFDHKASGRSYEIVERDDQYFMGRSERGYAGKVANAIERQIHYVMGSGRHARTYIHRTPQGRLAEFPLAWYPEKGGFFGMSPGYDRADPQDFRRKISFDCMFCHNAYPAIPPGEDRPSSEPVFPAALPEGIDCQRCHGPGGAHVQAAGRREVAPEQIRAAIVNPARLSAERSMEVCMQCHLETTSFPLPNSLIRFGRGAFSYRPGEPLERFILHFDHAKGTGREEKFEIVNSVYRLRQSPCFLESKGKLRCTTC
ncbi:MAG: hypothetical protein ABIZ80_24640, partial [Bryobacteraceae bacterium]